MSNEITNSKPARPQLAFMDTIEAAAYLRTDRLGVLKLIEEGRLKTFGGKANNPFVRTDAVLKLAEEFDLPGEDPIIDPKVVHRNDPVRKLKLRIQQDAKWPEVDEGGMRAWARELDPVSYERMRQVARDAISQLQKIILVLDETETARKK